jgi:hypothetical protein
MHHTIKNHLSPEQFEMLKGLKGTVLKKVFIDDVGEFALSVLIDSSDRQLLIKNVPTIQSDRDEYPKLEIEQAAREVHNYKEVIIEKVIRNIIIIRDEAVWQNNNDKWIVNSDIGIKIILEDEKLLLVAHDSLAGFIKIINIKKENFFNESKLLEEYWSMKTDLLDSLKREQILV